MRDIIYGFLCVVGGAAIGYLIGCLEDARRK